MKTQTMRASFLGSIFLACFIVVQLGAEAQSDYQSLGLDFAMNSVTRNAGLRATSAMHDMTIIQKTAPRDIESEKDVSFRVGCIFVQMRSLADDVLFINTARRHSDVEVCREFKILGRDKCVEAQN